MGTSRDDKYAEYYLIPGAQESPQWQKDREIQPLWTIDRHKHIISIFDRKT